MKTEKDFGAEYAASTGDTDMVDIDAMCKSTNAIPADDYLEMRRSGVDNPSAREYWTGYNEYIAENN